MDPTTHVFQRAYFNQTLVDPFCAIILGLMCVLMICVGRKFAVWPMMVIACFISQAQRLSPGGVDFVFLRIITVVAVIRILIRGEFQGFKFNMCDLSVVLFMGIRLVWAFLKITKGVAATPKALCGEAFDMWGMYFFFRCVIRDFEDLKMTMYGFILISIPNAALFVVEYMSLHNPFAFEGGVSDITRARDGKLRCMGAYSHPILAGCFWAALMPYLGAMIKQKGQIKILPIIGICAASVLIILSGSSSPIAGAGLAFLGGCAFLFRKHLRKLRWFTFFMVAGVQLAASSPIWHVFARVRILGGSTGYYRFKLIDQFIHHFGEWWLAGSARGTSTWQIPMFDIVNYYVTLGLNGGLLFVALLVFMIVAAFRSAGQAMKSAGNDTEMQLWGWATGVAIFVQMMTFLAVTYYGQIIMIWFFTLAVTNVRNANPIGQRRFSLTTGRFVADPLQRLAARPSVPYQQRPQPTLRRW